MEVVMRRNEILDITKAAARRHAKKRLEEHSEVKKVDADEIERDAFFTNEDVDQDEFKKREVDKRGNVI